MSLQQVLRLTTRDSLDGIIQVQEPHPVPKAHEVLVKVRSVALNFRDIAIAVGKYPFQVKDDVVPGSDAAGDIVSLGEGVSEFSVGDKVVLAFDLSTLYGPIKSWESGLGGPVDGVLREYINVPASAVVKVPVQSTLSYAQWASSVCTGATAWNALYGNIPLRPGQSVLFLGGYSINSRWDFMCNIGL